MNKLEEYKNDFILFLEAGFIAINQSDEDAARKLFNAAQTLDPQSVLPKVGVGYLHLQKLEIRQACTVFENVLKDEPTNEMAQTFLGLCFCFSPKDVQKGEDLLKKMKKSKDPLIIRLSDSALDFVKKFVKKAPSPVEIQKKTKESNS